VSVLLRQADGCEGLFGLPKDLATGEFAVADRPYMPASYLDHGAAASRSKAHNRDDGNLIATLKELLGFGYDLLKRLEQVLEILPDLVAPVVGGAEGVALRQLQCEVWKRVAASDVPVLTANGVVDSTKHLDVRLRHRPRSIPQAQESA
jgi:hypothetical protein